MAALAEPPTATAAAAAAPALAPLRAVDVRRSKTAYPTGNPNFAVVQPFPAAFGEREIDPFLMCDEFGPAVSKGANADPDRFPVGWHPHVGMDICTYMREGVGRHADSLGNRGTFESPGFQWISVGSGIEHAEGGGTPAGQTKHGFQIWVNVPQCRKKDDPKYGTENSASIPYLALSEHAKVRVLAGPVLDTQGTSRVGPFQTAQPVQICDFELGPGASCTHTVPAEMRSVLAYVYRGKGTVAGQQVAEKEVVKLAHGAAAGAHSQLTASSADGQLTLTASAEGPMHVLFFAGKPIGEPIAWHGPFVLNSRAELQQAFEDYQLRRIPHMRCDWDYKRAAAAPGGD